MSRLIPIILLSALILQTGFKVVIYLDYQVNKDFIALKYCENKAKPQMKCHGKCHLKKKLDENSKQEEQGKNTVKEIGEISPFVQQTYDILKVQSQTGSDHGFCYLLKKTDERPVAFLHPPSMI